MSPFATGFARELLKVAARAPFSLPRAAGYGALAGLGMHAGKHLTSVATGQPVDLEPGDSFAGTAERSAAGGAAIAGLLNLINRVTSRR